MRIRETIREWLGTTALNEQIHDLRIEQETLISASRLTENSVRVQNQALSRIIAKLDPLYGKDELSTERRADSDRIEKAVLDKLYAELTAARRTAGQL